MALLLCALSMGCTSVPPVPPPPVKTPFKYVVGPGDVLFVSVFDEPKLEKEVVVTPDGKITFPLAGTFDVADHTLVEVADIASARLVKTARFVDAKLVNLSVTLRESRSAQVQVVGEVGKQGGLPFHDRLTLVQAIGGAGGVQWRTAKTEAVRIVRGPLDDPELIAVDLDDILEAGDKDVFLVPGDIIVVPAKYVTRFDRYVEQLLSPVRSVVGSAQQGAGARLAASGAGY